MLNWCTCIVLERWGTSYLFGLCCTTTGSKVPVLYTHRVLSVHLKALFPNLAKLVLLSPLGRNRNLLFAYEGCGAEGTPAPYYQHSGYLEYNG